MCVCMWVYTNVSTITVVLVQPLVVHSWAARRVETMKENKKKEKKDVKAHKATLPSSTSSHTKPTTSSSSTKPTTLTHDTNNKTNKGTVAEEKKDEKENTLV